MKTTKNKSKSTFAQNIILKRKAKNWNQNDLAEAIGVHVNTIKDIERDISSGNPGNRQAIAQALGCNIEDLYLDPNTPRSASDIAAIAVLSAMDAASPAERFGAMYLLTKDDRYLALLQSLAKDSEDKAAVWMVSSFLKR